QTAFGSVQVDRSPLFWKTRDRASSPVHVRLQCYRDQILLCSGRRGGAPSICVQRNDFFLSAGRRTTSTADLLGQRVRLPDAGQGLGGIDELPLPGERLAPTASGCI